jgi:hypothetical protein
MRWWTLKSDKGTVHMHDSFRANALIHWAWKAGIYAQDLVEIYPNGLGIHNTFVFRIIGEQ